MEESLTGRDPRSGESLIVKHTDGRITSIDKGKPDETAWVAPGLIDLQVNGYQGDDVNADNLTIDTLQSLARRMLTAGVTTFLPTLITAPEEKIIHNLRMIAAARLADPLVAQMIPFVHVEGPHVGLEDGPRGAHPRQHVRPPDIAEFMRWQAASGDLVGMVTLSPHYAEAPESSRPCPRAASMFRSVTAARAEIRFARPQTPAPASRLISATAWPASCHAIPI